MSATCSTSARPSATFGTAAPTSFCPAISISENQQPAADLQQIAWDFLRACCTAPDSGQSTMEESESVCASFWTLKNDPGKIADCQSHFSVSPSPRLRRWASSQPP
ncbi:MAG: hypothetical protein H0T76_07330 [Nannocystis sp.]|nr:hypothetical protein [Nannocystis sp.]MBA3546275.1 hypothetical protein [Nannocystis sp.]